MKKPIVVTLLCLGFIVFGVSAQGERPWVPNRPWLDGNRDFHFVDENQDYQDGHIHLVNPKTQEELDVHFRDGEGNYDPEKIAEIRHLLRCRLTGREADIPIELIELVAKIQGYFKVNQINVLSGYRSPALNENLRRMGRRVARHSLHMKGLAMDIQLPGVSPQKVRDYAKSLQSGGVGYYPRRQFIHVDVGPVRYW